MPTDFTPFASLGGGILIGIASVLLMANFGRVMGATGILAGFLMPTNRDDWAWRASLLAGMVSAPALYWLVSGQSRCRPSARIHHSHGYWQDSLSASAVTFGGGVHIGATGSAGIAPPFTTIHRRDGGVHDCCCGNGLRHAPRGRGGQSDAVFNHLRHRADLWHGHHFRRHGQSRQGSEFL